MENFLVFSLIGLTTAAIYAVIASGLVLTYTTTGVFNFAHGAAGMLAAFAYWQIHVEWGVPTWLAVLIVLVLIGPAFGLLLERAVMRGLDGTSEATKLVVSISLLLGMIGLANVLWDPTAARTVKPFFPLSKISLGPTAVTYHQVITMAVAVAVAVGLRFLLTKSRLGVSMRAVVDDSSLTTLNGVRSVRVAQYSWAIGTSLAALGGILIASSAALNAPGLSLLIVNAYAAAVFGRLRSLPMTFVGAAVLGLTDGYLRGYLPSNDYLQGLPLAAPSILLFILLLVMPTRRLRTLARTREYFPAPTLRGGATFLAVTLVGGIMAATTLSVTNQITYAQVFAIGIIAVSLVPLVGLAGQISLCQLTFAGIGAVVMAHVGAGGNPIGFVVAIVVCAVVGALVALPALRLSGIYLALATAAFAVFLDQWIFRMPNFNIGPIDIKFFELGSVSVDHVRLFGVTIDQPRSEMILATICFVACTAIVMGVHRSRFGRRLLAMRDSEAACATFGMDLLWTRLAVFMLSAAIAGFGGALWATQMSSITPDSFNFVAGLPVFMLVVIGGAGFASSGLFTGLLLNGFFPFVSAVAPSLTKYQTIATGGAGLSLGREPSGAAPQFAAGFEGLRSDVPAQVAMGVVMVAAWAGRLAGLYPNWTFVVLLGLAFAAAVIASNWRLSSGATKPVDQLEPDLELVGLTVPWTPEILAQIEAELRLEEVMVHGGTGGA